jgi:hypothetical protein
MVDTPALDDEPVCAKVGEMDGVHYCGKCGAMITSVDKGSSLAPVGVSILPDAERTDKTPLRRWTGRCFRDHENWWLG